MKLFLRDYAVTWCALFIASTAVGIYVSHILNPFDWRPEFRADQVLAVTIFSLLLSGIRAEGRP